MSIFIFGLYVALHNAFVGRKTLKMGDSICCIEEIKRHLASMPIKALPKKRYE